MHRIMFDTNDGNSQFGYELKFADSLKDIAAIGNDLRDGLRVIIYMPRELEMEAVLKFDPMAGIWLGIPVAGTTKIYPEALDPLSN
jgi:hypothetical protein